MSLTAAASGFVVVLLSAQGTGQDDWGVTYSSTEICALKGSTVEINCTYTYPSRIDGGDTEVKETFWFTKLSGNQPVDLSTDSDYQGRVEYSCYEKSCTLRITDLRESDSAEYKFSFITNQPGGRYTGSPGVTLRVTDLQVKVSGSSHYDRKDLKCHSSCRLPDRSSYICPERSHQWQSPSQPEDLSEDSQFAGRVQLTCSSDANPAANYTWYKKNGDPDLQPLSKEPQLVFSSIQSSDSGEYYCTAENELGRRTSEYISIDVTYAPKLPSVSVSPSAEIVEGSSVTLTCSSDANPAANYTWYKENEDSPKASGQIFTITDFRAEHSGNYYCEAQNSRGRHNSTLQLIVVAGLVPGSVDASPAPEFPIPADSPTDPSDHHSAALSDTQADLPHAIVLLPSFQPPALLPCCLPPALVVRSVQSLMCVGRELQREGAATEKAVSPQVRCLVLCGGVRKFASEERMVRDGLWRALSPGEDAPKLPSVSVSPSAEIVEGSSVNLTCSSDANPAANYCWYKKNGDPDLQPLSKEPQLVFSSIQSSDSGQYYCTAENELGRRTSEYISINVTYAPKPPSVSVSPSAEIVEGSSVTLTCSSDANPAANYTWYKENEDSPKASGQIFTITDFRAEHSGNYYCEAQNSRGRHNATLQLIVVAATWKLPVALSTTAVLLVFIFILVLFCIRRVRSSQHPSEAEERPDNRAQREELQYGSVRFTRTQADALYSNFSPARPHRNEEESVVYASPNFISASG
ncbi:B-cell receptor CD22-like [Pagrus major]|uniref:B-cell receptor CD22-like n=1 Tax=Pagrus major TaxID=143350 RepID=UPI003CC83F1A